MSQPSTPKDTSFVSIARGIWMSKGEESLHEHEALFHPTVVIIFGWMGAQLPHLHKYTQIYRELYPRATQVLIQSNPSFFWISEKTRRANLKPAAELLTSLDCIPPTKQRILVHAFSNGGTLQLKTLGSILPTSTTSKLPTSVIIFDSAPGKSSLSSFTKAFTAGIRSPLTNFLFGSLFKMVYCALWILQNIGFKNIDVLTMLHRALWGERVLPWTNKQTPRLYLYSRADELVGWEDVQAHADEARRLGFSNVKTELFEDTPHVAHARADPKRYWSAIEDVWTQSCKIFLD